LPAPQFFRFWRSMRYMLLGMKSSAFTRSRIALLGVAKK
jgi:hypothetical protein